jgi:PAS domain S-box-containing protein
VDLVTHSATWTRETYRLFGVAPDTFVPSADTLIGLLHPDDRDAMREWIRAALAGAPPEALEFRVPLPDGSVHVLLGRGELIYADDHRPLRLVGTAQDVTERVQADESLRFTQFAVDHTADAAFWMTEEGRFFYVNEAACRALGYSRDELLQMTVFDIDPAFTEKMWRESWRRLKTEKTVVLETVHRAKEGRTYPVEIRANYLEFGGRVYDCAFARDITERKRAEEEVAESRKRYRGLVEKINDWVWEIDADGVYTYSSPRARDLLGYPPEEILGKTPFDFMPPAEAQRVGNVLQPIWRERKPLELIENTLVRKDGSLVTIETSGMPMFAEDGAFLGYTGIDRDVTLRKQAQDALRESEQRYRRLIENLKGSHFIYRHDTTGVLTYVSESVTQVLGYTAEEGLPHYGKYFTDHPANQAAHQHTERTLQGIRQPPYEVNVWHKDGSSRWLEVQEVPVYDAGGKVVAVEGVAQDITERKRAQEALRRLNEQLELQVAQRTEELRHTVDRLQQLTLELSQAEDRERQRIADILHDDVQQMLAAAKFHLNLLSTEPRSVAESREIVEQVKRMLKDAIEKSRRLSH